MQGMTAGFRKIYKKIIFFDNYNSLALSSASSGAALNA